MISFARGVPAPECLAVEELADCARAALERDGHTILSYGPGGGYGPLREWLAERHGVEPSRVVITSGSLQGFVFLAEQLGPRQAGPRRGADVRPAAQDPGAARRRDRDRADGRGRADPRRAARGRLRVPLHDPDLPEPERADAVGRAAPPARRARRASGSCSCSRTTRTASSATTATRCRACSSSRTASRSRTARPSRRRSPPECGSAGSSCPPSSRPQIEALAVSTYISPPYLSQATVLEFLRRGSFGPNLERVNGLLRRAPRRHARGPRARAARGRELDTSGRRLLRLGRAPVRTPGGELLAEAERGGRHLRQGHRLLPRRAGRRAARCGWPSASSRPTRSPRVSQLLGRLVRAAAPAAL